MLDRSVVLVDLSKPKLFDEEGLRSSVGLGIWGRGTHSTDWRPLINCHDEGISTCATARGMNGIPRASVSNAGVVRLLDEWERDGDSQE